MTTSGLFSGEPLPVAPNEPNAERAAFDRKLLDYLRRLSAKLAQYVPTDGGEDDPGTDTPVNIPTFSAFNENNQEVVSTGTYGAAVAWERALWRDSIYEHTDGNSVITVTEDGFYLIWCDLEVNYSGYTSAQMWLMILDGSGTPIGFPSFGLGYYTTNHCVMTLGLPLAADTHIAIYLQTNSDDPAGLVPTGTRINIIRVRTDISGGDNDTPGAGWEPDDTNNDLPDWVRIAEL